MKIEIPRKATTLTQPWASAVIQGWKKWETRPTVSHYRGLFWIHAGSNVPAALREKIRENRMQGVIAQLESEPPNPDKLPTGSLLGIVELQACLPAPEAELLIRTTMSPSLADHEIYLGGYCPGRFAYKLKRVAILKEPIPCKGKQGWWFVPDDILSKIEQEDFTFV